MALASSSCARPWRWIYPPHKECGSYGCPSQELVTSNFVLEDKDEMGHLEYSPASPTPKLHVLCTKLSVLQVPFEEPTVEIHLLVRLGEV